MREMRNAISFRPFFFFLLLSTIAVTSYTPVDNFAVKCGRSGNTYSPNGRKWTGDTDSGQFSLLEPYNGNKSSASDNPLGKTIPYSNARLSHSEFSYVFPVKTDGQKFIRLHFYPSTYNPNFLRYDAFFSVKAGPHTLLKDFNASLNADVPANSLNFAAPEGAIVREYCVNVELGQTLNVTFTPNASHPNAYAFVNGIEVVSMPNFLYYTTPENQQAMILDGGTQLLQVSNISALETLYRTNVGGSQIPSDEDTGMFRYWGQDNAYLESGERPNSVSAGFDLNLIYKDNQSYFAPDAVYKTARKYGMNEKSKFNVTWEFKVDLRVFLHGKTAFL